MKNIRSQQKRFFRLPSKILFPCVIFLAACNPFDFQRQNPPKYQSAKQSAVLPGFTAEESRLIENYTRESPTQIVDLLISKIDNREFTVYGIKFEQLRKTFELLRPEVEEIEDRWGTFDGIFSTVDVPRPVAIDHEELIRRLEITRDNNEKILAGELESNVLESFEAENDSTFETDSLSLRTLNLYSVPIDPGVPVQCNLLEAELATLDATNAAAPCDPVLVVGGSAATATGIGAGVGGPGGAEIGLAIGIPLGAAVAVSQCIDSNHAQDYYSIVQTTFSADCRDGTNEDQPADRNATQAAIECLSNNTSRGGPRLRCMAPPSSNFCAPDVERWDEPTRRCVSTLGLK